jgi:hypothetical protein
VAPGQVSLRPPLLSSITIIPLIIRYPLSTTDVTRKILVTNSAVKHHTKSPYGLTLHANSRVSLHLHSVIARFPPSCPRVPFLGPAMKRLTLPVHCHLPTLLISTIVQLVCYQDTSKQSKDFLLSTEHSLA